MYQTQTGVLAEKWGAKTNPFCKINKNEQNPVCKIENEQSPDGDLSNLGAEIRVLTFELHEQQHQGLGAGEGG